MKRQQTLLVTAVLLLAGCCVAAANANDGVPLTLVKDGQSPFSIVIADDATPATRYGAEELQRFLQQISGAELPIRSDRQPVTQHEILLGASTHLDRLGLGIDLERLGKEGYTIRTTGGHLVLVGGAPRGNLYGVYGLLEDHLGCRWFTPTVSRIPKLDPLTVGPMDETSSPVLEYREPFVMDCFDGDWCARNRVNSSAASLVARHGGKVRFGSGMFVHTFNRLVPPERYFDAHPEYFSEIGGKRIRERSQLCCTNEDVVRICTERLRQHLREDPTAAVFSLSQNDWANYCECDQCRAVAEREGSQMGPVLYLVNRVAEALEAEFPDQAIETLAYTYTRKPPNSMRPRQNVIIRLCSIECCFMHPLAQCDQAANQAFVRDLRAWSKVANRLWVWNYVTSFHDYLVPFPNLRVRDDNIRLLVENHVTGIFQQDVYTTVHGELSPLSGYLNAKLLWNPNYDEDTAINEFLTGVYGPAAGPIRAYIDLLHNKVADENIHANIWVQSRTAPYLTDPLLAQASTLWDQAERAVAGDAETLARVQIARLSIDFALLERQRGPGGTGQFVVDHAHFQARTRPAFVARAQRFFDVAGRAGVTWLNEGRLQLDSYRADMDAAMTDQVLTFTPAAPVRDVTTAPGLEYAFYAGTWDKLPDWSGLTPSQRGVAATCDLDVSPRATYYALRFTGLLRVPRDGLYTFYCSSNDGSRLTVAGQVVVDNDGLHAAQEIGGFVALKAGLHPIQLEYFQEGGAAQLVVGFEGPGVQRQAIPAAALFHQPTTGQPE